MPLLATLSAANMKGWGPNDVILVTAVRHEVVNPVNPTDGKRESGRHHSPFTVTKRIDQSTPFFHEHQTLNKVVDPWKLQFIHNPPKGKAANYLSVTLENARVVGIRTVMPRNSDPGLAMVHEYEEISFAYTKITWNEEKVKDSEGSEVFQKGTAEASDDKNAGLLFAPDWLEEQARGGAVKLIAELEQLGVHYGTKMYDDLVTKLKDLAKQKKN